MLLEKCLLILNVCAFVVLSNYIYKKVSVNTESVRFLFVFILVLASYKEVSFNTGSVRIFCIVQLKCLLILEVCVFFVLSS